MTQIGEIKGNSGKPNRVLVIGGGIAGIQASLDLADAGVQVILVEHTPSIGGHMAQLDKTFPTNDCSMCILSPKMVEVGRHPNIVLYTLTDVLGIEGEEGNFTVTAVSQPRHVDMEKCIACGECSEVCPRKVSSDFEEGLAKGKAIHVPFPQAFPLKYSINEKHCTYFGMLAKGKPGKCMKCQEACPADAVVFDDTAEEHTWNVSSVILTMGFTTFDATECTEYGYGTYKNVLTAMEFERMLSASGPFEGHIKRLSDNESPKNIAFIQCVGSRNSQCGNNYCSSVCCMYGMKESIIAKEHQDDLDVTIFYMDIRAHGKEFDYYYKRAKEELEIEFIPSRVANISEDKDKNLILNYTNYDESLGERKFDMVVLCTGIVPTEKNIELCKTLGVELNHYNFPASDYYNTVETSRPGIFISGAAGTPIDIPETVASASGSAALSAGIVQIGKRFGTARAEEADTEKEVTEELVEAGSSPDEKVLLEPPRIGVFVCHCGINIGKTVDVKTVAEYAQGLPNVVYTDNVLYACSQDIQDKIKDVVKDNNLNRVVVASCTPRTHEPLFQNTITEVNLNPYLFEMTNIREHCSWVHGKEPENATQKAMDLVRMAVAKSKLLYPLDKKHLGITRAGTVIGGGLAGMTAALEMANQGFKIMLIERSDKLGGNVHEIHSTISGEDPREYFSKLEKDIYASDNIDVYLNADIQTIEGYVGNFKTKLKYKPVGVPDSNGGPMEVELEHGTVIVATGAYSYSPTEYSYKDSEQIITQRELEQMMNSGKFDAKSVVMIQCVGSRDEEHGYCSRICCGEAVKNALAIKKLKPECDVDVLYKDIRTYGLMEDYFKEAGEAGIRFLMFDDNNKPKVSVTDGKPDVEIRDFVIGENVKYSPDLLVLSAAVRPQEDNSKLSQMLKVPLNRDGFFLEAHMKLRPVDFATEGVFICGMAHSPKFINETITQARAAAMRAGIILSKPFLETEGMIAFVTEEKCRGCGFCVSVCPYEAIELVEINSYGHKMNVAKVNEALCKGCGTCAAVCLNGAIQQKMFEDTQLLSMIARCLEVED
jgi:heterodisulfide reductase subunit A